MSAIYGEATYGDIVYGYIDESQPQESRIKMETVTTITMGITANSNATRAIGLTTRIEMVKG